jgi:hypothetical protein
MFTGALWNIRNASTRSDTDLERARIGLKPDSRGYGSVFRDTSLWIAMLVLPLFTLLVLVHVALIRYAFVTRRYYNG